MLLQILNAYGFNEIFKLLIFKSLTSGNTKMLLNGSCYGQILTERGIKQKDPMSLFLFVLFLELLSKMISKMENDGKIQGIKIGRLAPTISHIFFADDILIFCNANVNQVEKIINCLETFCSWTGQSFNPAKSRYFFSSNIQGSLKAAIKSSFNMNELDQNTKYLGTTYFPAS